MSVRSREGLDILSPPDMCFVLAHTGWLSSTCNNDLSSVCMCDRVCVCVCPGLWKLVLTRSSPVIFANYSLVENQRVSSIAAVYSSEYLLFVVGDKVRNIRALVCQITTRKWEINEVSDTTSHSLLMTERNEQKITFPFSKGKVSLFVSYERQIILKYRIIMVIKGERVEKARGIEC